MLHEKKIIECFFPQQNIPITRISVTWKGTHSSSLPLPCHTLLLTFHPPGWCRKGDTPEGRTQGAEKILKFESKCGFIREMDAFPSPSFSLCMIQCGSSFSFPVCLSSAGGCSYCSPALCSQLLRPLCDGGGSAACIFFCCFLLWGQRLPQMEIAVMWCLTLLIQAKMIHLGQFAHTAPGTLEVSFER